MTDAAAAKLPALSNAQIADRLAGLAQLLAANKENPYKVKAYRRAAANIRSLSESLDELVRDDADLTTFPGIGDAIASAIREIVLTGALRKLDTLRGQAAGSREVCRLSSSRSQTRLAHIQKVEDRID
jgi:DNA polymerase (family X)